MCHNIGESNHNVRFIAASSCVVDTDPFMRLDPSPALMSFIRADELLILFAQGLLEGTGHIRTISMFKCKSNEI